MKARENEIPPSIKINIVAIFCLRFLATLLVAINKQWHLPAVIAIQTIKSFCQEFFPNCSVQFHSSRKELCIANSSRAVQILQFIVIPSKNTLASGSRLTDDSFYRAAQHKRKTYNSLENRFQLLFGVTGR